MKILKTSKTRKKKKLDTEYKVDSTQRTIYEFFPNKVNNNVFVGSDDSQGGPVLDSTHE